MNKDIKYRFYPSLLDKFQEYIDSEIDADDFWNLDEDGQYKKSPDEIADERFQALLDTINRVPHEPWEAADKGTCFNEIVDCIADNKKSERKDMKISTTNIADEKGICAEYDGFCFNFDANFCKEAARRYVDSLKQFYCSAILPTKYGNVELYGFADEIIRDKVVDIKTTSKYDFGKYEHNWQRHVYPYCLTESGGCETISEFDFDVYQLKGGNSRTPLITGTFYKEAYTYNHKQSKELLTAFCEHFIEWLENNRDKISDKKIFNQ